MGAPDVDALLAFYAARAVPGVEAVDGAAGRYARALHGRVVTVERAALAAGEGLGRVLAGDPAAAAAAEAHLAGHPLLGPLVRAAPGLRVPGHPDGAELAVRAVLGQQVSVAAARTLAGRLAATLGAPLAVTGGDPLAALVTRGFPVPAALAELDPEGLPMPRARGRALVGLAGALAAGAVDLSPDADVATARAQLLALRGIGPWTADYVVLRALRAPDVLLVGDLGVLHALRALGADTSRAALRRLAEEVAPHGSLATLHLWHTLAA